MNLDKIKAFCNQPYNHYFYITVAEKKICKDRYLVNDVDNNRYCLPLNGLVFFLNGLVLKVKKPSHFTIL